MFQSKILEVEEEKNYLLIELEKKSNLFELIFKCIR